MAGAETDRRNYRMRKEEGLEQFMRNAVLDDQTEKGKFA